MFVHIGFGSAAPGRESDVEGHKRAFAQWLSDAEGLVAVHLLRDANGELTGISFWEDRASFERAMARPPPNVPYDPTMYAVPPQGRKGEVVATWTPTPSR